VCSLQPLLQVCNFWPLLQQLGSATPLLGLLLPLVLLPLLEKVLSYSWRQQG
jgi:hypothetical protein